MNTTAFEFRSQMEVVGKELSQLETSAGIAETVEKVNEGCFFPYGIFGEGDGLPSHQGRENYFDSEFDHRREGIREIYFGVANNEVRKALIRKARVIERTYAERAIEDKLRAEADVAKAQSAFDKPSWKPIILIIATSLIFSVWKEGWAGFSLLIGGLIYAYFYRRDQNHRRKWELNQAKESLATVNEDGEEDRRFRPERFSQSEEMTGERSESLDGLSATYLRAVFREKHQTKVLKL